MLSKTAQIQRSYQPSGNKIYFTDAKFYNLAGNDICQLVKCQAAGMKVHAI
jgi:hypothetical protein